MKVACVKCNGNGYVECLDCGHCRDCSTCDGSGDVLECLTTVKIPKTLRNYDQISLLQQDALRCVRDHERISILNPSHKLRYDSQLTETLQKLEFEVEALATS